MCWMTIRDFYMHRREGWPLDEDGIVELFARAWTGEGFITREHEEERRRQGEAAIRAFYRRETTHPSSPAAVEAPFELALGHTIVRGRFDRVDVRRDGPVIVDFKSSDVGEQAVADQRAADSLQLKLYALAWAMTATTPPVAVELHYVATGVVGRADSGPDDRAVAAQAVDETARGIRARAFSATPSYGACGYCAYNAICPSRARGSF